MDEKNEHVKFIGLLQSLAYTLVILNIYLVCVYQPGNNKVVLRLVYSIAKLHVFTSEVVNHLVVFILIVAVSISTKAKKDLDYNIYKHFVYRFIIGIGLFLVSFICLRIDDLVLQTALYGLTYLIGSVMINTSLTNLSKMLGVKLKKDIWNREEQSFPQNQELVKADYLLNIPMEFYYQKKWQKGWMNINVFRAIMVIGPPGSGKTESVIIPAIKQLLTMGYSLMVYDFKYPDLTEITYYHYLLNKQNNGPLADHTFHVINVDEIEYSERVNPILPQYITTLSDAAETAEAIVMSLRKGGSTSGGADQFFTQSGINLLASTIYYFAKVEGGKYCTLPHVMAFLNLSHSDVFDTLFRVQELQSLLSPFRTAHENKAFDQLEGQVGTLKINLSRLATKETFWVFSGNDIDLKISDPKSIVVLANNPRTQNTNSAFYSSILFRTMTQINQKGNNASVIIVDETPTIYIHKIQDLIATARSNRVSVILGLQEITQFYLGYQKEVAQAITSIIGTILSGPVRSKDSMSWLTEMFGKVKQVGQGVSIDHHKTNINLNERMDSVIPASRIANLNAGELVGIVSRENKEVGDNAPYRPNLFNCKVSIDFEQIREEKKCYIKTPLRYTFGSTIEKEKFLMEKRWKIISEVQNLI